MRGQKKVIKSLRLTGNVYLKHYHDDEIAKAQKGDIYLCLNDEEELYNLLASNYQIKGFKGYFKAKIYDGKFWCFLDSIDFFEDRIHQFNKAEICFYRFELCQERLQELSGTEVYRTYREHYTTQVHQSNEFKGKKTIKPK